MVEELENLIETIEGCLDEGDFEEAQSLLPAGISEYPECEELYALQGDVHWALGLVREASAAYEKAVSIDPQNTDYLAAISRIRFSLCDFFGAHRYAKNSLKYETRAEALDVLSRLADRSGRLADADRFAAQASLVDEEAFLRPFRVSPEDFAAAVEEAIAELPDQFRKAVRDENVAILIEPFPEEVILIEEEPPFDPSILGLYRGTPLIERSEGGPGEPDTIHIFQHNLERAAETPHRGGTERSRS